MNNASSTRPRTSAGRPRLSEVEPRTRWIVDCAANLFIANGYHKVSLNAIAREANVAVRTIYVKFGGKAGLFDAMLRSHRQTFFTGMPAMNLEGRSVDEVLHDFARRYLRLVTSDRAVAMQRMVITEAPGNPELSRSFMLAGLEPTLTMLAAFFTLPGVRGIFNADIPPERLARHLITCLMGDFLCRLLTGGAKPMGEPSEASIREALSLFLHGCGTLDARHRPAPRHPCPAWGMPS
jgi:TetR/AcrR family transcriptional repressor of mexJK operon